MENSKRYRKIVNSCNWDRININEQFWSIPVEIRKCMWEKSRESHLRLLNAKNKE